jgi:hypothetical protein
LVDGLVEVTGADDFHGIDVADALDLLLDAGAPSVFAGEVVLCRGIACTRR